MDFTKRPEGIRTTWESPGVPQAIPLLIIFFPIKGFFCVGIRAIIPYTPLSDSPESSQVYIPVYINMYIYILIYHVPLISP